MRWLNHLLTTRWTARRHFPSATLDALEVAIAAGERTHRGELRVVIEAGMDLAHVLDGVTPRQRALQVFADLGVWDTQENNGVLLFVDIADHAVEIVADRGYRSHIEASAWAEVCAAMSRHFAAREFQQGALYGIGRAAALMASVFPGDGSDPDELPNRPSFI